MKTCLGMLALAFAAWAAEPQVVALWPGDAPGSEGKTAAESVRMQDGEHIVSSVHRPSITVYLPAKGATGAGIVIIPGGGHRELWMDHEGYAVASWLSQHGVAGFVLKYRLAREQGSTYSIEGTSLADVQRAIRLVRSRSAEWGVDPQRVGVMGFSAGGQLAALAGTRYDNGNNGAADPIDRLISRPAFQVLMYPGIPAGMKISKETPPAFMACGDADNVTPGLADLYSAFHRAGASAELHIYAGVGHGFGIRATNRGPVAGWIELVRGWLGAQGFLK